MTEVDDENFREFKEVNEFKKRDGVTGKLLWNPLNRSKLSLYEMDDLFCDFSLPNNDEE